jgi:hypothetical protein
VSFSVQTARTPHVRTLASAGLAICLAAILPYTSTVADYFVRDDFGGMQLLASKPATYFPRWFVSSWMDEIWGFVADEVRPFTAVSYQLSALAGAASPVGHHLMNLAIHAGNGLLVFGIARVAGSLSLWASLFAALIWVLLPVHAESVAWITGRVDSLPALFYLASFLAYAWWRARGSASSGAYVASLALFFAALFSKQNTITLPATLVTYDLLLRRTPARAKRSSWEWTRHRTFHVPRSMCDVPRTWHLARGTSQVLPYVPFVAMTAAYLWLRYVLFGEAVRESRLTEEELRGFLELIDRHLRHVIGGGLDASTTIVWVVLALIAVLWALAQRGSDPVVVRDQASSLLFFGPIWWAIGVAPIAVASYASPRHVYLAAVGWAVVLGIVLDAWLSASSFQFPDPSTESAERSKRRARSRKLEAGGWKLVAIALLASAVLTVYTVRLLGRAVPEWKRIAAVSEKAVDDITVEARSVPVGSLIIAGVPQLSWEWALPFAVQPPYAQYDLTRTVFIISPRNLHCCRAQWFEDTGRTLAAWATGRAPASAVALRWDERTGLMFRADERTNPSLPIIARALRDIRDPATLDRTILRLLDQVVPRPEQAGQ